MTTRKLFAVFSGLLILLFLEGMMTLGHAFDFEDYNIMGWIVQIILLGFTVSASLLAEQQQ